MTQASPTSQSSFSSVLADALTRTLGVQSSVSETFVKPAVRASKASKYTNRIRQEAASPELWGDMAKLLTVDINEYDEVTVGVEGSPEQKAAADALEYGTPNSPPVAVMRTYAADFTEDYKVSKNGYDL